jgi:hypothetical protein
MLSAGLLPTGGNVVALDPKEALDLFLGRKDLVRDFPSRNYPCPSAVEPCVEEWLRENYGDDIFEIEPGRAKEAVRLIVKEGPFKLRTNADYWS